MRPFSLAIALVALGCSAACSAAGEPKEDPGATSLEARIAAATAALETNPQDKEALARRAALYAASGQCELAIADYDRLLKLDPARAEAYDARGSEHFKLGHVAESIADFDRFIKLRPDQEPWHWKRGISYYYAGRWDDGQRQFEGYQTVDENDVENAVWRYLCMARGQSIEAARKNMLKIKPDLRAGMMEVYNLYAGNARPDDVLAAAKAGSPAPEELNSRLFYAHLYLGLYYESLGDAARAKRHIDTAVTHKIGHYMWNVADVHAKRLHAPAAQ
ncbi:MAG: tetratricopeptide repeat protein [Pirellulales bacterium]